MRIVVIGGTGLIGSRLIARLEEHGHEGVAAAPNTGVNTVTGEGLDEVLVGADVVVDVLNSPSFADDDVLDFFTRSTSNLLAAEKVAGVAHHVALSIVGTDRLPASGYLRAKVAQEKLIRDGGVPFSIVHATQFYEFTNAIAQAATVDRAPAEEQAGERTRHGALAADDRLVVEQPGTRLTAHDQRASAQQPRPVGVAAGAARADVVERVVAARQQGGGELRRHRLPCPPAGFRYRGAGVTPSGRMRPGVLGVRDRSHPIP